MQRSIDRYIPNVGAGLLANAVDQLQMHSLTHRIREQARSHRGSVLIATPFNRTELP